MLLKNPVLPFQPLLLLFTLSIHHTPQRFLSVPSTFPPFLFFPTNDPTDEPSPFRGRIPAVCFTHFPHICIKFEKLLSTNTKFIPEKSRSLDFPIMCRGTCSILNRKSDESDSKEQNLNRIFSQNIFDRRSGLDLWGCRPRAGAVRVC